MENEILNENIKLISIPGTLRVVYLNGRHGPFPVGTLYSCIGQFTVRDSWLETFDEGEYEGIFEVQNIDHYSYRAYGETRTAIRAVIEAYALNDYNNEVVIEDELSPDPLEEENPELSDFQRENSEPEEEILDNETDLENEPSEEVKLLISFLDGSIWWEFGDNYRIDSTIGRENIVKCKKALVKLGYTFDPLQQVFVMEDK